MTPPRKTSGGAKPGSRGKAPASKAKQSATKAAPKKKGGRKTLGGPELKMPSFRKPNLGSAPQVSLPAPVASVVSGLRERRLLPVVIGLVAAIIAVPLLLSNGDTPPEVVQPVLSADAGAPGGEPVVVVNTQAGVRDPGKRLAGQPKNPFDQPAAAAAEDASGVSATPGAAAAGGSTSGGASAGATGATGATGEKGNNRAWVTHTVDVFAGSPDAKKLKLRRNVEAGEIFPNSKSRLLVFFGVPSSNPDQAWFLLSSDVVAEKNEGKCALGKTDCEMIALKTGQLLRVSTLGGQSYTIKLAAINRVFSDKPPQ